VERFNKIWTTCLAGGLTGIGLFVMLEILDPPVIGIFFYALIYIVAVAAAFLFHIILHEAGHCVGGLLSGYEFASFRVFNVMIVKRDGKFLRKKFHVVGTGGQCLMAPPQPYHPDFPYKLYNLAGGLTNLIVAALCILPIIPAIANGFFSGQESGSSSAGLDFSGMETALILLILNPLIVAGLYCGITNLVPMVIGGVPNDGWNLFHLGKDPEARRIFWLLLDAMAVINRGGQFRDMPQEWFWPAAGAQAIAGRQAETDYNNSFQFSLGVYRLNYLEDAGRLDEAADLARELLKEGSKAPQLYRYEITCELIFLELIGDRRLAEVEKLYTPELERYIKATESYPQRQRLRYAMAMLYDYNEAAAAQALERFKAACKTYPNDGEISSEWEAIGLVDCKLAEVKAMAEMRKLQGTAALSGAPTKESK